MSTITGHSELDAGPSGDLASTGRFGDRIFSGIAKSAGVLVVALVAGVGAFLLIRAVPALAKDDANFLTDRVWDLRNLSAPLFGIPDLLWVTVISSFFAMLIAVPVAVGVALFLTEYAPKRIASPAAALVDLLAAVPSIVYGLWGLRVLSPHLAPVQSWIADLVGWMPLFKATGVGGTVFLASVVLAIMIL